MNDQARKYLFDIQNAIRHIRDFIPDMDAFEKYAADLKTQSAVERQLSIIGEAIVQYRKLENAAPLSHSHQIAGLRNRLIHAYDAIDPVIIWAILQNHLSPLMAEVEHLLEK